MLVKGCKNLVHTVYSIIGQGSLLTVNLMKFFRVDTYGMCNDSLLSLLLETSLEVDPVEAPSPHRPLHVLLEGPSVGLQLVGRLLVQRVVRVGFEEEVLQPVDDRIDREHRLPVLAQDIQTHIALQVDVRMIDAGDALHFGRLVRVARTDLEGEDEPTTAVVAFVGRNDQAEVQKVIGVGEVSATRLRQLQLVNVLGDAQLRR